MNFFASKEKRSALAARKAYPYVHHPMGPVQQVQQAAMRKILRPNEVQAKPDIGEPDGKYEQETDHAVAELPVAAISGIPRGGPGGTAPLQRSENEEPEEELQRQPEEEEEEPIQAKLMQRQPDNEEEEEPVQARLIQRKMAVMSGIRPSRFGHVEPWVKAQQADIRHIPRSTGAQAKLTIGQPNDKYEQEADRVADQVMTMPDHKLQRRQENDEEEPAQAKLIQCQSDSEEEEEPVQAKLIQRQSDNEEEEEPVQAKPIQRQSDNDEEEEPVQAKLIQRQSDNEEEEEPVQAKLIQRQMSEIRGIPPSRFGYVGTKQKAQQAEVGRILRTTGTQAKLTLGQPNDKYEQEADRVADKVIAMPDRRLQRQTENDEEEPVQAKPLADHITPVVQRQEAREEEEEPVQAKAEESGSLSVGFREQLNSKASGSPLPDSTKNDIEPHFGSDLSGVRVHTDSSATRMNKEVGAQAFTHGSDIYFNEGKYNPDSTAGKHLLAHELTHVVQQGGAVRKKAIPISHVQQSIQRWSIKGIINKILSFIPGFTLVTVFLGENPVTGDPVPQTGKMLMKGATELIPIVGPILWGELEKSGTTENAGKWLDKKMKKLGLTIPLIKDLISKAWDAVSIWKGIDGNIAVVKKVFGPYLGKTISLIRSIKEKVREFIIEGFLRMAGPMGIQVWNVLRKSPKALKKILDNPVILIKNFFQGVKLGFDNFGKNFAKHFKNAVMEWIFGTMGEAGLQLPAKFDLAGIFSIVMQVLGLTYNQIRARVVIGLAKVVGRDKAEKAISMIETGVEFVKRIITKGPIVLWDMLKEKIGDLKQMVLGAIVSWAKNTIITKAVLKLVSMLNPAGAIFQAIMMVYDVVTFFINNWDRIKSIVTGIFNSLAIAALGQIGKIGKFIEGILAKGMTVLIAFLARLIGLGGIAKKVQEVIAKIRKPITKAVGKVVGVIINLAKPIIKAIAKGGKKLGAAVDKAKQKGKAAVTAVKEKGKAVVGRFKDFIFPKKSLKIGRESHTISGEQKGTKDEIVLRSNRMSIPEFIENAKKNGYMETAKLDNLKSEYSTWTGMPKDTEAQRKKKLGIYTKLLKKTESIWKGIPIDTNIPPSNITWGSIDSKGRATSVKADPLTIKGVGGSPPSESIPGYTPASQSQGRPTIYEKSRIKAHLLHHDMHGPGKGFNLTPTSNYFNRFLMFPLAEKPALHALGVRNYGLSIKKTTQLKYETTVTYENRKTPVNKIAKHVVVKVTDKVTGKNIASFSEDNYTNTEGKQMEKEVT